VVEIANELPASAWKALQVREGAVGPLVFEFVAVRVWGIRHRKPGPPCWLLIRRSLGSEPELKFYVSNADAATPLSTLALVACTRCRVEEFLEDCKSYLGMTQYETRSWVGWHHHMTLVGLAHLFVTLVRKRLQKRFIRRRRAPVLKASGHADPIWSCVKGLQTGGQHVHQPVVSRFLDPGL
jgi:hypothetical protein